MTAIYDAPQAVFGAIQLFAMILCVTALYGMASGTVGRLPFRRGWLCVAVFALDYTLLRTLYHIDGRRAQGVTTLIGELPAVLVAAAELLLALLNVYAIVYQRQIGEVMLTPMSIKESYDGLPAGLCFCDKNGMALLVNHRMSWLCHALTGGTLLDTNEFWRCLCAGESAAGARAIRTGERPVFETDDAEVWMFERERLDMPHGGVYQISAVNITARYRLGEELDEEICSLRHMNESLREYGETVYDLTREEELLAAKVSIHDCIGQALLTARRYIESGDETIDRGRLLQLWRYSVELLQHESSPEAGGSPVRELEEAAKLMGVRLVTVGEPPRESRLLRLMTAAALECINNAVRHAGATELYISSTVKNGVYTLEFTNNGAAPENEFAEGGGLRELRRKAEQADAVMETEWRGGFLLRLSAQAKGGAKDDGRIDS